MTGNTFFKLYSYNIPVMGRKSSIILSFQEMNYTVIPQFLCEILQDYDDTPIESIENAFNDESGTILEYFHYLEKQQLGFFTETPKNFPKLTLEWDTPEMIKDAVIEIESFRRLDYQKILKDLDKLLCKHLEVWILKPYSPSELISFLSCTSNSVLRSLSIVLPYQNNLKQLRDLKQSYSKLANVYLYNTPGRIKFLKEGIYGIKQNLSNTRLVFKDFKKDAFIIYIEFFMESIHHNPFYNKKMCIDKDGYIKNCLTHENSFGNIINTSLEKVARDKSFQELWFACNDKIEEIKDSEFRYIWFNTHNLEKLGNEKYKIIY